MTKLSQDFLIGGRELDLSELDGILSSMPNELAVGEVADVIKKPSVIDTTTSLQEVLELSQKISEAEKYCGYERYFQEGTPFGIDNLPKHKMFINATQKYRQVYLSGGNRVGKTFSMAWMTARHLTGEYPDWYTGRRFTAPIDAWAAGDYNGTTRDIMQLELMGKVGEFGTGMIPKDRIVKVTSKTGVSGALDTVYVRHKSGGVSSLQFKAYKQSNESFYGTAKHWIWLDELPSAEIYSECFTRTMTTNGIVVVTATPLEGITPLVFQFYSEADFLPEDTELPDVIKRAKEELSKQVEESKEKGQPITVQLGKKVVICIGWDDAPWLSEEQKVEQLAACPPHLRQARSTGLPGDAAGQVFPIPMSEITCDDFPIPAHYKLINAVDPGWHYTGAAFGAIDPDTDTLYIYADYKRGKAESVVHAEAIKGKSKWKDAPCIFDYAGMGGRSEEQQVKNIFRKHGLRLINADKSVEAGLSEMWDLFSTGKLKIFKSCKTLIQELTTYRRDDNGKIIKENDHVIDSTRYLVLGRKHARTPMMGSGGPSNPYGQLKGNVTGRRYF